jgi:hypothetical protein
MATCDNFISDFRGPGEFAHKSLGKIYRQSGIHSPGLIPGAGSSGTRKRFQWVMHEASVEVWGCGWGWCARALGPVRLSRKILGKSLARRKILGVICRKFWEIWVFCIIRRHRSRVHQSRLESGVMWLSRVRGLTLAAAARATNGRQRGGGTTKGVRQK